MQIVENKPKFRSIQGNELLSPSQEKPKLNFLIQPAFAQTPDGTIDIAFLSDKYTDLNYYHSDIDTILKGFLKYQPFKARASQFKFHIVDNTEDIGCTVPTAQGPSCDYARVDQRINQAGVPHDYVIIIIAENSVNIGGGLAADNKVILLKHPGWNEYLGNVLAHEMGHALGKLLEEYNHPVLGRSNGVIDNQVHVISPIKGESTVPGDGNCYAGTPPAAAWNNLSPPVALGDYKLGCTYPNWYAPSKYSVMNSPMIPCFNAVSQQVLNRRLDALAGAFPGGPVPIELCPELNLGPSRAPSIIPSPISNLPSPIFCGGSTTNSCPSQAVTRAPTNPPPSDSPSLPVLPSNTVSPNPVPTNVIEPPTNPNQPHQKKELGLIGQLIALLLGLFMLLIQLLLGAF